MNVPFRSVAVRTAIPTLVINAGAGIPLEPLTQSLQIAQGIANDNSAIGCRHFHRRFLQCVGNRVIDENRSIFSILKLCTELVSGISVCAFGHDEKENDPHRWAEGRKECLPHTDVMALQRIEGCSDREAVDRFTFDTRWKYAAGGLSFDYPGVVHTVLVDMRARPAASAAPDRIFEVTLQAAKSAGLAGRKRVLDSTPLYDAVATMDTVTLLRSGIRGLLKAADKELEARLRAALTREDDYASAGKLSARGMTPRPAGSSWMRLTLFQESYRSVVAIKSCPVKVPQSERGTTVWPNSKIRAVLISAS